MNRDERDVLSELRELPPRDADAVVAERTRTAALGALALARAEQARRARRYLDWAAQTLGPIALAGMVAFYLTWAASAAAALFR